MSCFGTGAQYLAVIFDREGRMVCEMPEVFDANWGRLLDKTSAASLTVVEDCCACVPTPQAHELALYRESADDPVWQGPITKVEHNRSHVVVSASDKSLRWFQRETSSDISHAGAPVDSAVLFSELIAQAEAGSPSGLAIVPSAPTGVTTERAITAPTMIGPILNDLSRGAIDWTIVGLRAYAGGVTTPAGGFLPLVTSEHWDDQPTVFDDGVKLATRVIVRAGSNLLGIYPPGPAVADPVFGIIEVEIAKPDIASQPEADAAAKTFYELHKGPDVNIVTREAALSTRFPYELADLIPGRIFPVDVDTVCNEALLTLRLGEVDVTIVAGHEQSAKIDLQAIGTETP